LQGITLDPTLPKPLQHPRVKRQWDGCTSGV
jgi:hypothetical protein